MTATLTPTAATAGPPPGVSGLAALAELRALRHDPLSYVVSRRRRWGDTWQLDPPAGELFDAPFVMTCGVAGMRDVLTADDVTKSSPVYREMTAALGEGLLTSEGDVWRQQRRTLQPLFTRKRVDRYARTFHEVATGLAERADHDHLVDLDEVMGQLSLGAVSRTLFGTDVTDRVATIVAATAYTSDRTVARGLSPVRTPRWLPTPGMRRLEAAEGALRETVDDLVDARRGEDGDDLVSLLLAATDPETGEPLSAVEVREQALVFLLAGHDTTSTTMTFALHLLGHHADWQRVVRDEVTSVDDPVAAAIAGELPVTRRVVDEALRLHSPAYITSRMTLRPTTVDGHDVPAGATVATSFHGLHRNPDLWEDPDRFDPDRFLPERVKERDRYAYLPFGGGPRACIGNHFALLEATLGVAAFVARFELTSLTADPEVRCGITMRAAEPVLARLTRPARPGRARRAD